MKNENKKMLHLWGNFYETDRKHSTANELQTFLGAEERIVELLNLTQETSRGFQPDSVQLSCAYHN